MIENSKKSKLNELFEKIEEFLDLNDIHICDPSEKKFEYFEKSKKEICINLSDKKKIFKPLTLNNNLSLSTLA